MNIVFFMSDSFRYDNLSCYGPAVTQTPRLDGFATQAHVFENAYLGSFPTVPNRLDIASGRFSCIEYQWQPLPAEVLTLQQILTAAGTTTQLISDTPHIFSDGFNYDRGWSGWEWIRGQGTDRWKTHPREVALPSSPHKLRNVERIKAHYRNTAWWTSEEDRFVARTVRAACDWLEGQQGSADPFFLCVDTFDPHEPWDAPQPYVDLYDPGYEGENPNYPLNGFHDEIMSERELRHVQAEYRAEATMVDTWFGVLLDKLDELGLSETTAVIFTADHGYLFGEHGIIGKSLSPEKRGLGPKFEATRMYNDIRRTPLLIHLPGQRLPERHAALVQSPDLMPTFLELGGLVTTERAQGKSHIQALHCDVFYTQNWEFDPARLHGRSLVPLLHGAPDRHRDLAVSSNTLVGHSPQIAKSAILTEDGWCLHYAGSYPEAGSAGADMGLGGAGKLLNLAIARAPTEPALFYLPDDPAEEHDVIDGNEALAREIHARYVAWLEELGTPEIHLAGRRSLWSTPWKPRRSLAALPASTAHVSSWD
jgi:arylsulfatase A-like enzyme